MDIIFYDGSCGLCHSFVRFVLLRMQDKPFMFSPIGGKTFSKILKQKKITAPPDSIAVYDEAHDMIYYKAEAVLYVLKTLPKKWQSLTGILKCFPLCVLNMGYTLFAKIRSKLFKKPEGSCPVVPQKLRKFFKD